MSAQLKLKLAQLNRLRFAPSRPDAGWQVSLEEEAELHRLEVAWIENKRSQVVHSVRDVPRDPTAFVAWFEALKVDGPGQGDRFFPWLAEHATLDQMKWFLRQEVAVETGFDDLVALTQVRMPEQAKLQLAANYWDQMGRGYRGGMHGPMLSRMAAELDLASIPDEIVWESTALGNLLAGLAANRRYAYQSIGALGVVELTAPGRAKLVNAGLERLGIAPATRQYYALHARLDVKHSEAWNREVVAPLVSQDPSLAPLIAEGALMRLEAGAACFERYRRELRTDHALAA